MVTAHEEARRFLELLRSEDASLAASALDAQVGALLASSGAPRSSRAPSPEPVRLDNEDAVASSPDFEWYAALLASTPAVDSDRAAEAAHRVEVGMIARERLESLGPEDATRKILSDLHDLIELGEREWDWLILSNLRLVFHWSRGIARSIDSDWAQDAFQAGVIGLMRGLERWDHKRGYRVSTFVSWHIRQQIQRWQANDIALIRLPVHVWEKLLSDPATLSPSLQRLADNAQNIETLEDVLERADEPTWDGGIEAFEERYDRKRTVATLLLQLTDKEINILEMRHGLSIEGFNAEPLTLDQVGAQYGLTRERIRQIEAKALKKLRGAMEAPDGSTQEVEVLDAHPALPTRRGR